MDIMNIGLQKHPKRYLKVTDIKAKNVINRQNDTVTKIVITAVEESTQKLFTISDVWVKDRNNKEKITGIWVSVTEDNEIPKNSSLGKLLDFYSSDSLSELLGKTVVALPDDRDFLTIRTY